MTEQQPDDKDRGRRGPHHPDVLAAPLSRHAGGDPVVALRYALAQAAIMRTESVHLWAPDARALLELLGGSPKIAAQDDDQAVREAFDAEHRRQDN